MDEIDNSEKMRVYIGGLPRQITVRIKNSARSSNFKVWLESDSCAVLSKPCRAPKREAMAFLERNKSWITEQICRWKPRIKLSEWFSKYPRVYADKREWKVWLGQSRTKPFFVADDTKCEAVFMVSDEESLLAAVMKFAESKLAKLAFETAKNANLHFKKISVRDQSGRWASMSTSSTMSVNWRVLLLPPELQNYIFCHELAHIKFMDHSLSFWIFLNGICPSAKRLDAQVSKLGAEIFSIG